jgi:hypothetical protein
MPGLKSKLGRNPFNLLLSRARSFGRSKMAHHEPDHTAAPGHEPQVRIPTQEARQGRSGTRTLVVLTISLILAAVAGVALGIIPMERF